jgi:hypothetical protein
MQEESKKKTFERSGSTRKQIRFEDELVNKIDSQRDNQPFATWVKDACNERLENINKSENK